MRVVWLLLLLTGWAVYWYFYMHLWNQPTFRYLSKREKVIVIVCIVAIISGACGIGLTIGKSILITIFQK